MKLFWQTYINKNSRYHDVVLYPLETTFILLNNNYTLFLIAPYEVEMSGLKADNQ